MLNFIIVLALSYLVGAIPTAILTGKLLKGIDVREHGSGNAGATNAVRVLGWKIGGAVLLFDIFKGFVAVYFISQIAQDITFIDYSIVQILAGLISIIGHIWTVFANFQGGKGVATAAGMFLGLAPYVVLVCMVVFALSVALTRMVSVGSLLAVITLSACMAGQKYLLNVDVPDPLLYFTFFATLLVIFTHRSNITRILNGTENKFSEK